MALRMPPDSDAVDSTAAQGGLMRGPRENAPTATLSPLVSTVVHSHCRASRCRGRAVQRSGRHDLALGLWALAG